MDQSLLLYFSMHFRNREIVCLLDEFPLICDEVVRLWEGKKK